LYGAQMAYPIDKLDEEIGEDVSEREHLYYTFGRDDLFNQRVVGWMRQWQQLRPRSGKGPAAGLDPAGIIHRARLVKSDQEITCMREAIEIAAAGHAAALRTVRAGLYEYEIQALLDYTFRQRGGSGPAYPSIVAAGPNATILHYTTNDQQM